MQATDNTLTISQAARLLGISEGWLRKAEARGSYPPAPRDNLGRRYYTHEHLAELRKLRTRYRPARKAAP